MVTLKEGMQIFQQGASDVGKGIGTYAEEGRLAEARDAMLEEPSSGFIGGEQGQQQAAVLARQGDIRGAQTLREHDGVLDRMNKIGVQMAQETDPDKRAQLADSFNKMATVYQQIQKAKTVYRSGFRKGKYKEPKLDSVVPLSVLYDGVESKPLKEDIDPVGPNIFHDIENLYEEEVSKWEENSKARMKANLQNYTSKFGNKYHQNTLDSVIDFQVSENFRGDSLADVDEFLSKQKTSRYKSMAHGVVYDPKLVQDMSYNESVKRAKKQSKKSEQPIQPSGVVVVEKDGKRFNLPQAQLKQAQSEGYKLVR